MFRLTDPVDYELDADWSIAAEARAAGVEPAEMVYDLLLERDGTQLLYLPLFNFAHGNFDDIYEMITRAQHAVRALRCGSPLRSDL